MRIVICAKEVLDPDAVNAYAVAGRLQVGEDGRTLTSAGIPVLMNAYDEQAIEAALRLRDGGLTCTITVITVGAASTSFLRRAAALGADEMIVIPSGEVVLDTLATAVVLGRSIESSGGADLVFCGRQASDDDQGVVPAVLGERLGMPVITMARDIRLADAAGEGVIEVTRVTPDGDEEVRCALPAVVTVSNELGTPRYPSGAAMLAARRKQAVIVPLAELGLGEEELAPRVELRRLFVPQLQGTCEFLTGETAQEQAVLLLTRLRADGLLPA
ncbi:MAG: electron transfer flavoprotein subunit beta/FixA family protein [Dehalococcoidia bacterium]